MLYVKSPRNKYHVIQVGYEKVRLIIWRALKGVISQSRETGPYLSAISPTSALLQCIYHIDRTSAAQQHMRTRNDPDPSACEEDSRDADFVRAESLLSEAFIRLCMGTCE